MEKRTVLKNLYILMGAFHAIIAIIIQMLFHQVEEILLPSIGQGVFHAIIVIRMIAGNVTPN
jgi:hypothetical protein